MVSFGDTPNVTRTNRPQVGSMRASRGLGSSWDSVCALAIQARITTPVIEAAVGSDAIEYRHRADSWRCVDQTPGRADRSPRASTTERSPIVCSCTGLDCGRSRGDHPRRTTAWVSVQLETAGKTWFSRRFERANVGDLVDLHNGDDTAFVHGPCVRASRCESSAGTEPTR